MTKFNSIHVALLMVAAILSPAVRAEGPSAEAIETARRLGLSKDMKTVPQWALPAGTHYSNTAPSNFPVEVYRSNVVSTNFVNSTSGAASASLCIVTKDAADTVFQFYKTSMQRGGWVLQIPNQQALAKLSPTGQIYLIKGSKDTQQADLQLTSVQGQGTMISITWRVLRSAPEK